jgi:PleD family two-component response regulator
MSCGQAEFSFSETAKDLLRRANKALYQAKKRGKTAPYGKKTKKFVDSPETFCAVSRR